MRKSGLVGMMFDHQRGPVINNTYHFLHLNLVSTQGHLNRILKDRNEREKVIIASDSSQGWGFSREALMRLASDPKNLVVLTERLDGKQGWVGNLWQQWEEKNKQWRRIKGDLLARSISRWAAGRTRCISPRSGYGAGANIQVI